MKKLLFLLFIVVLVIVFVGATYPKRWTAKLTHKKTSGCGYRIIEYGVGVDCNGDTVKLVKTGGLQRLASHEELLRLADSLSFGGAVVTVDAADCSRGNGGFGNNFSLSATNAISGSQCMIQFGDGSPIAGTYNTIMEKPIGTGQVILRVGGSSFGGSFVAGAGQNIIISNDAGKYKAIFKDIILIDTLTKAKMGRKLTGHFGCN